MSSQRLQKQKRLICNLNADLFHNIFSHLCFDHGTAKYANLEGVSGSSIDFQDFTVVWYGCCFDRIEAIFKERFLIQLRPLELLS